MLNSMKQLVHNQRKKKKREVSFKSSSTLVVELGESHSSKSQVSSIVQRGQSLLSSVAVKEQRSRIKVLNTSLLRPTLWKSVLAGFRSAVRLSPTYP